MKNVYHYSIEFPFSNKTIKFREITTEEQLHIAKARMSFNTFYPYFEFLHELYGNVVKNKNDFDNLDIIEFLMFIIKNRILSVGPVIELYTKKDGSDIKISLELNDIIKNLYNILDTNDLKIKEKNFEICIGLPVLKDYFHILSCEKNYFSLLNLLHLFIKSINGIDFKNLSFSEQENLYNNLPLSVTNSIKNNIISITNKITSKNIFGISFFDDFKLNIFDESIYEIIKIFCSYEIKSIHREIYLLSTVNESYLMNLTPIERQLYISFLMEQKTKKENDEIY